MPLPHGDPCRATLLRPTRLIAGPCLVPGSRRRWCGAQARLPALQARFGPGQPRPGAQQNAAAALAAPKPLLQLGRRRGWRPCAAYTSPAAAPSGSVDEEGGSSSTGSSNGSTGPPGPPLTVEQLKRLTELHVGDVYAAGVVGDVEELATRLGTSLQTGLATDEAALAAQRARYGSNLVKGPREATFLELAWEALQDFTVIILLVAGTASLALELVISSHTTGSSGSWIEGASILASVTVVVLVTAVNNYQKERQFRALQDVHKNVKVRCIRGGKERQMSVFDLLVGDLVLVEAGDILPVDGVLVEGSDIKVDESHLTGEADDVEKNPEIAQSLLSGSKVLSGFGRMLVTAVGPNSQAGAIAEMVAEGKVGASKQDVDGLKEETLLQSKLATYAKFIGRFGLWAAVVASVAMTARFSYDVFVVQQLPWSWEFLSAYLKIFITGVTILVVAVPEGLPLAVTLSLAYSVKQMLADNNLVRHLSAAETMGTANVICSDKTGTLTQNNMVVARLWLCGQLLPDLRPYMTPRPKPLRTLLENLGSSSTLVSYFTTNDSTSSAAGSEDEPLAGARASRGRRAGGGSSGGSSAATPTASGSASATATTSTASTAEAPELSLREELLARVGERVLHMLGQAIAMNSTANVFKDAQGRWQKTGNRTEVALLTLGLAGGLDLQGERNRNMVVAQAPFSSERKRMTTAVFNQAFKSNGTTSLRVFTKGAAEIVMGICTSQLDAQGQQLPLTAEDKARLLADFTTGSQRVLCLAYRDVTVPTSVLPCAGALTTSMGTYQDSILTSVDEDLLEACHWDAAGSLTENLERDLVLIGVVGIEDPLRPEVPQAIRQCQHAGITVKMLTGDNVVTAASIARQCGILPPDAPIPIPHPAASLLAAPDDSSGSSGSLAAITSSSSTQAQPQGMLLSPQQQPQATSSSSGSMPNAAIASIASGSSLSTWSGSEEDEAGLGVGAVMEGAEFRERVLLPDGSINGPAFLEVWSKLRVLARCTPADKFTIVKGVKTLTDEVIAVTGDGTNDAPALRAANVGFAMNAGTDTAKEAADIVLLDNNFASIVSAVLWGRGVYANITRFLQFQLTINLVAVATAVTGALVAAESPLTAVQMLWVNLIMDSLASLALATEPPNAVLLDILPFSKEHEFVDPSTPPVKHIVGQALYQLVVMYLLVFHGPALLGVPDHSMVSGPSEHYTIVFNAFVLMQLFNQVNCRKILDGSNVWDGLPQATLFNSIAAGELLLQFLIVQYGGLAFHTHPLSATQWGVCFGIGATTLLVREVVRRLPIGYWHWDPNRISNKHSGY